MANKYKVLCFVDDDHGRDVEIVIPVVYYMEKYLNCEVEFVFVWDIFAIYRKKPDMVLIPNTVGHYWYFQASQYAYQQGVKVFALISEGNFRTDGTFNYWGYNTDKKYYQEYICHWSHRTLDYLSKELPQYTNMVVTGAQGFDRYSIYQYKTREELLAQYDLSHYTKVIGYAGWAFGKMYTETGRREIEGLFRGEAQNRMKWMEEQMLKVEEILRSAIENNPDILFIFKQHPNEVHPHYVKEVRNEMNRLKDYDNVLYIKDEENIHDLINIADFWMGFESTTAIEAWLLNETQTVLVNPDPGFKRDKLFNGSVIASSKNELQQLIDGFYNNGKIDAFFSEDKIAARKKLIKDTIGFGDGMNHIRTGYYIEKALKKHSRSDLHFFFKFKYFKRYVGLHFGKMIYLKPLFLKLPKFKKTTWIFDRYRLNKIPVLRRQYYGFLDVFHEKNHIAEKRNDPAFWRDLL